MRLIFFINNNTYLLKIQRKSILLKTILLAIILSCCTQENKRPNRVHFTIDPEDRKIVVPVQLNDSITARLAFDNGWGLARTHIHLDSSIIEKHPSLLQSTVADTTLVGSTWGTVREHTLIYNCDTRLNIGDTSLTYAGIYAMNWKKHMNSDTSDGVFNIPLNDTIHVWELNFENNYIEIHLADNFAIPKECYITAFTGSEYEPYFINLPLYIKTSDNDTLTLNGTFFIDAGMPWDIALMHSAREVDLFNQKKDAVWTKFTNNYHRHYNVEASLFDDFLIDSLRIYTFDYPNGIQLDYLIGLNFLKRFNVFFDMKNKQLGLQAIKNFQRVVNPLHQRFRYSTEKTDDGRFVVKAVGDYEKNYYKAAGLQIGDEIVTINKIPYGDISMEMSKEFMQRDTVEMNIIRNGQSKSLLIEIDHDQQQGD